MKKLSDYEVLNKDVFYRCEHILDYIKSHPDMPFLEKEAIKATIMDALTYKNEIDRYREFLNIDNLEITDNPDDYRYEEYPFISGIPLWMKDELRKHCIHITGGIPISMFLAKPPSKIDIHRYCVYDPNTAVSSIFEDATFYNVIYTSPTRGVKIESKRPFVEVNINGVKYLVDVLTKRIIESSYFKNNFGFDVSYELSKSDFNKKQRKNYNDQVKEENNLAIYICMAEPIFIKNTIPNFAEMNYELEKSKEVYPQEWEKSRLIYKDMEMKMGIKINLGEKDNA